METDTAIAQDLRISCGRDDLASRLATVSRAVSSRGAVQVLSGVLLRRDGDTLELAATDMELSIRTSLQAEVEGDGALVVPARLLVDLVRLLPEQQVTIAHRAGDPAAELSSGSYASRLNTFSAEDFPRLPPVDVTLHEVDAAALLATVERVERAASRDESRPVLTGIQVRFEGARLIMAATDSYRLSVKETALTEPGPDLEAIIPARALTELKRIAAGEKTVQIGVHENHVVFRAGDTWLTTRRIDGQFPNVSQLRPETFEVELTVSRAALLDIVKRAGVMAQRSTPLRLRFADGELTVSAQAQDVGETRETMPVAYTGEPLEIGFNADFLREGLESVEGGDVALKLINPLRPGLITGPSGDEFWYLIMPIRLAG